MKERLKVYRASAGSGKTFTIAVEYIKLLVLDPTAYRNILAVTFTNKATAEMKERILSQLYGVSHGMSDDYLAKIAEGLKEDGEEAEIYSPENIKKQCAAALNNILHDYGHFRIQTIDAFFQSVLRSVAKELKLTGDLETSLDGEDILSDTVDTFIKQLSENDNEIHWITEYIKEQLENEKNWKKVSVPLKKFANNLLNEEFQQKGDVLRQQIDERGGKRLTDYRNALNKKRQQCSDRLKALAEEFFSLAESANDCKQGTRGIWGFFMELRKGELPKFNKFVTDAKNNPQDTLKKYVQGKSERITGLINAAAEIEGVMNSCDLSLKLFHQLRLINSIDKVMQQENRRANRFMIAQTSHLLSTMLGNSASFVYEKIGTEIKHIFIDEFQDTSSLQWICFKTLLEEVMAHGTFNFIVGDVKQSIYRWRNSDWSILNNIEREIRGSSDYNAGKKDINREVPPCTNFRSEENIVEFNNSLYTCAKEVIKLNYEESIGSSIVEVENAYKDVRQAVKDSILNNAELRHKGYVEVHEIEAPTNGRRDVFTPAAGERLMDTLDMLMHEKMVKAKDITILVRKNSQMAEITRLFNERFPDESIVSSNAFEFSSSAAIQIIIAAMRYIDSRGTSSIERVELVTKYQRKIAGNEMSIDDLIGRENLETLLPEEFVSQYMEFTQLPIYELIEKLIEIFSLHTIEDELSFLYSFLDYAAIYSKNGYCDIKSFLEEWEKKLCSESIAEGRSESVRIMSIFKSKGLQFHTVIIPFCNWPMTSTQHRNTLWCRPKEDEFDEMCLLPIEYSEKMKSSIYNKDFYRETLFQLVDNLNLLYVATTRAENNLIIITDRKKSKNENIGNLVNTCIGNLGLGGSETDIQDEYTTFKFGEIMPSVEKKEKKEENPFLTPLRETPMLFTTHKTPITFRQSRALATLLTGDDKTEGGNEENIERGELLHEIMSRIATGNELPREIRKMQLEGVIADGKEAERYRKLLQKAIDNPKAKEWFDGSCKLINERTILNTGLSGKRRPDRVMIKGDTAIVVDYKFTNNESDRTKEEHRLQVRTYMDLLWKMGYTSVTGYLWYIFRNEIVKC